jgi:hypothetical protein
MWISLSFLGQTYKEPHEGTFLGQAGEISENSLISEIFGSTSEKNRQVFLLNAYVFRDSSD